MVILAFAIIYIVWGSTYYFIQVGLTGFPPFMLGGLRFLAASLLMFTWCYYKGEKIAIGKSVITSAIVGSLLLFVANGAVIWSEKELPSSLVAIIFASQPLSFVLLDKRSWKENLNSKMIILGITLGTIGVFLLFGQQLMEVFTGDVVSISLTSMFIAITGTLAFSSGSIYSKYHPSKGTPAVNVAWQMLTAGILFSIGSISAGEIGVVQWENISIQAWASLGYLTVFGSIIAFSSYIWLLGIRPTIQVSTYAYVNPIVAIILGMLFASERISAMQFAGLSVILIGVFFINYSKYRMTARIAAK